MIANLQGKIITFYSYKGGVGRSMILANTAWILATNGKKVLVIDWDLEAPGLDRYFHPFLSEEELMATPGLINFLTDFLEAAFTPADEDEEEDENWYESFTEIEDYLISLNYQFPQSGQIDLLAAGQQGNSYYAAQVNAFNWDRFYEIGGGRFLEAVKEKMRTHYDYILIDSRTGISDTAGICTVQMPDSLVILFSGNDQSILGAARVAHSVNQQWQADKKNHLQNQLTIFPVLSRTDRTEKDKLDLARQMVKSQFSQLLQHLSPTEQEAYWGNIEMPYIPWYAYEEVLATFRDNPYERASLLSAIEQLVAYLTSQEITELVAPSPEERQRILSLFIRQSLPKNNTVFLSYYPDDSEIVHQIATHLKTNQLNVWFEQWQVTLGESWELRREAGRKNASTFAIFIGKHGLSAIQQRDIEFALHYQDQKSDLKIIPIFLLDAKIDELPPTLLERKPLKFQNKFDEEALWQLERIIKDLPAVQSEAKALIIPDADDKETKHDIFVSYARVDNEPLPGADKGWVTTLINGLKNLLGQKLGRRDAYSLWMDYESRSDEPATPEIINQLENSIILLVILSPAYLESEWCRLELNTFLANICEESECLFIIERSEVERPKPINHLMGYKFWIRNKRGQSRTLAIPKPSSEEIEYYQKLDDIACDLSDNIKKLRNKNHEHKKNTQPIFLALVSDDLEELRYEIKRYLEQQNILVLPNKAYSFAHIQEFIDQDLNQCRLFVQLLSNKTSYHIPQFQYERAKSLKLPILQWCDKKLNLNHLYDEEHKQLLSQSTVMASSLEDFKKHIINQLKRKEKIKNNHTQNLPSDPLVFINATPEDMALAYQIGNILLAQGIAYSLPLEILDQLSATDIQNYLEKNLRDCDAIIIIYQNAPAVWVNEQIRYCWKIQGLRDQPFKSIVVYNKHATDKLMLSMRLPNLLILECPTPQTDSCLPKFIRILNNVTN